MMECKIATFSTLFLACFTVVNGSPASVKGDSLIRASNVSWSSYNFKTILTWGPKPVNYTYTVEFFRVGKNKERNLHCIRSTETECDLTNDLSDIKGVYSAEVVSEPLPGMAAKYEELPFKRSNTFSPYNDTYIGRPEVKLMVSKDKKITLIIHDPITALVRNGKPQTIRDIFMKSLKYKVAYNKAGSTGKKMQTVNESKVEFSRLDEDQSYCFSVAAYLPSRKGNKRVGEWSLPKCSPQGYKSLFEEYGLAMVGGAAVVILLLVIALVVLIVLCCKRTRRTTAKETITI